jgi:D-psicose/D-tagatose/L-ribulose 3-epimerase
MNKIGVHALSWVGGWSENEARKAIEGSARLGYDIIEIPALDTSTINVSGTAHLLEEHGLGATMSLGLESTNDITSTDSAIAKRGEEHLLEVVSIARDLGATHLCGVIHSAMQKYMEPATSQGLEQSATILRKVCEKAQGSGIEVGVEVVNRYESNLINTAAQGVEICKMIGTPNAKVHLDTYHMNIEEADASRAIVETGDYLCYFHIGESHRGYLGSGSIDFDSTFRALAEANYNGPITFESFSSEVVNAKLSTMLGVWRNLWTDGEDLCRHAIEFTRAHIHAAQRVEKLVLQSKRLGS